MIFSQEQTAIVEFYFAIKSHRRAINAFHQKDSGGTALNASIIRLLVQRLRDAGSVADRKRSSRAFIMKTKVADVETALLRSPLKRPSIYINNHYKIHILAESDERYAWLQQDGTFVPHHGVVWKF
ncbi:DUF4817 domain-containing protein [Trichonephila clavipes]|nr:DUF4817 domain-containing protein [Trichonephila clavipes]